jgi:predicted O-linked N-acetylglucosamine transferase (SPINDLY family)
MTYSDQWTAREVYEAHLRSASRFGPAAPARLERPRPGARIRLGYLSADFCQHSVAHFIEPVLSHHDRSRFEVFCYHNGAREDQVTRRLQACAEHWRSVSEMTDDELEQTIRSDRLDLLVELSGNTDGHRLGVLARRVAAVQVTYLGYPNTTGLSAIDYRITDARADPPGESDRLHVEQLVRLPDSFLCYAPPTLQIGPRTPPYRTNGYVTFGSFNNFPKLSPATLSLWTQILTAIPRSKLLVKSHGLHDPGLRALLLERLRNSGIGPERAVIVPPHADHEGHMRAYGQIDIALDTFPYNGTTTTLDALWMGVPVVTLAGDRHAARVGDSILSALGLPELGARSGAEYVSRTLRLANDPKRLDALAHSLRQRLIGSPLAAGAQFTSRLEQAYLQMVETATATV